MNPRALFATLQTLLGLSLLATATVASAQPTYGNPSPTAGRETSQKANAAADQKRALAPKVEPPAQGAHDIQHLTNFYRREQFSAVPDYPADQSKGPCRRISAGNADGAPEQRIGQTGQSQHHKLSRHTMRRNPWRFGNQTEYSGCDRTIFQHRS